MIPALGASRCRSGRILYVLKMALQLTIDRDPGVEALGYQQWRDSMAKDEGPKLLRMSEPAGEGSFDDRLDKLILKKEAEQAADREHTGEAEEACYEILRKRVGPFFDRIAERMKESSLDRRIEVCSVPLEGLLFLRVTDLDGQAVGDQLICFCDVERTVITLDIGEADEYEFDYDVEPSAAGKIFRSKAGQASYNYGAFSDELLERKVQLYLECFL